MDNNVIYIKTPKCASTSVRNELARFARTKGLSVLDHAVGFENEFGINSPWLTRVQRTNIFNKTHNGKCYDINLDHVTATDANINRLKAIMKPNRGFITISSIRDPYERLKSNYMGTKNSNWVKTEEGFSKWYLANCNKNVAEIFKGQRMIFPDWWINNFMCNYMGINEVTEEAILAKYDFITISEFLEDSMIGLSNLLCFKFKTPHVNKGKVKPEPPKKVGVIDINRIAKNEFIKRNARDYKLYELCKKLFLNNESVIIDKPIIMTPTKNKILFICLPKAASQTVSGILKSSGLFYNGNFAHHYSSYIKGVLGDAEFNKQYTFGIVRNPWDRLWSIYTFIQNGSEKYSFPHLHIDEDFEGHIKRLYKDEKYLGTGSKMHGVDQNWHQQKNWLFDNDGNQIVNDIFKFEDLPAMGKVLDDKFGNNLAAKLNKTHVNKTNRKLSYKEVYTDEMIELVREMYADDIKTFGYEFEN